MQNIVLVIHLILAVLLIGAVLLQRSEGGALGMGGGGNVMSGRGAATALQKATWGLAGGFIATSLMLTVFATQLARDTGVLDAAPPAAVEGQAPADAPPPLTPALPQLPSLEDGAAPAPPPADPAQPALPPEGQPQ